MNEQMRRFLEDPEAKVPPRDRHAEAQTRKHNLRKPLSKESPEGKTRRERLRFYRGFALDQMKKTQGFFSCQSCGQTVAERASLHLHHIKRRGQGGDDHFTNLLLVCAGPGTNNCHERLDGNDLQWTRS